MLEVLLILALIPFALWGLVILFSLLAAIVMAAIRGR
jgi:hypothetical protein